MNQEEISKFINKFIKELISNLKSKSEEIIDGLKLRLEIN